mmetsp:Transcript_101149/g.241103  ORF Transcript_101149/g.241103 Transcript_101149/m.241103 type:complete len:225 (-) Transcript_101149:6-680(-)
MAEADSEGADRQIVDRGLDHDEGQDDRKVDAEDGRHPPPEEIQVGVGQLNHGVERLAVRVDVRKPHDRDAENQHSHVDLAEVQRAESQHQRCIRPHEGLPVSGKCCSSASRHATERPALASSVSPGWQCGKRSRSSYDGELCGRGQKPLYPARLIGHHLLGNVHGEQLLAQGSANARLRGVRQTPRDQEAWSPASDKHQRHAGAGEQNSSEQSHRRALTAASRV